MDGIDIALSGFNAAQGAFGVIGNNIANAATDGYHRQRIELAPSNFAQTGDTALGGGVDIAGVTRVMDELLQKAIFGQKALLGQVSQERATLGTVESAFGELSGGGGLSETIDHFFNSLKDLGAHPSEAIWQEITGLKRGLVLVTGVTGSGKSTTISSLINHINLNRKARIITLEDPVEFIFKNESSMVSQRQVGQDVSSFSGGLKSALRENPDIIFVGEIRDTETATLALSAAETGHLVFSTLHTRDAKGALSRIVDMFPAEQSKFICLQLSFSLSYVLSQKLVPRQDASGRILVMEVLKNLPSIGNLIRTGNWQQVYSAMETQSREGMLTMEQHLLFLHQHGVISKESAIAYANDASIAERLGQ